MLSGGGRNPPCILASAGRVFVICSCSLLVCQFLTAVIAVLFNRKFSFARTLAVEEDLLKCYGHGIFSEILHPETQSVDPGHCLRKELTWRAKEGVPTKSGTGGSHHGGFSSSYCCRSGNASGCSNARDSKVQI